MKLKELKKILNSFPESTDDYEVIADIDNKGGYSSPISSIQIGYYDEEFISDEQSYGDFINENDLNESDCKEKSVNAIALFI